MGVSTLETPQAHSGSTPITPDFTIYTDAMEIGKEQDDIVTMIGSSTQRDLQGDTMSLSALTDMTKVEPGLTIWLNHIYTVPDSLFGSLVKSPGLSVQDGIADLLLSVKVAKSNPPAAQTLLHIKEGTRFGCSIGCMILDYEIDESNDTGESWFPPLIIHHVQTLEFSVVGIPANQRSWVETGAKGLFERMLSTGKGDEALRLAPIVKGLYPRAYQDRLKEISNEALRRDLEHIRARPKATQRIERALNDKTFVLNQRGNYTAMKRDEVSAFLKKSSELPRVPGIVNEEEILKSQISLEENDTLETKGASGKTSWPLADEDTAWDSGAAHKRIMDWAGGDDPDWSKVKSVHFWFDPEKADTWGGYKLPFADVIDGSVKAVPRAIYASAAAIQGARGGVQIPDGDVAAVKAKIEVYYHKMGKKAPWEDKEDSMEPSKDVDGEPDDVRLSDGSKGWLPDAGKATLEQREVLTGSVEVEEEISVEPPDLLDIRLFNVLAERLGQPQLTLNSDGTFQAKPSISDGTITEAIARALSVLDITKSGSEFSAKNRKALQDIHDGIVKMCKVQFHPCEEMKAQEEEENGEDDDGKKPENEEEDDDKEKSLERLIARSIAPLQEQFGKLMDALCQHGIDPEMIKALSKQYKEATARIKETRDQIAALRSMPLGQPTHFRRSVQGDEVATYDDFAKLRELPMNDNERQWTLLEALKNTTITPKQIGDEMIHYRLWPDGVGGSVRSGVRPTLTGAQRCLMAPMDAVAYTDGKEAAVPLYDDPGGVSM